MKTSTFIASVSLIVAGAAAVAVFSVVQERDAVAEPAETPSIDLGRPEPPVPVVVEQAAHEETKVSEPVQYFPPPTVDLSGSKIGNQRVPGFDGIGDIHQLYFHLPSYTLFMGVTAPGGLRSVWRLKENSRPERVFASTEGEGEIAVFGDSRGRLYIQHDNPCRLYRSEDAFRTWELVHESPCMFWQMADDGKGTLFATLHAYNKAVLFRSTDDGHTWEAWKDFQKLFSADAVRYDPEDDRFRLRHLHGVIYNEKSTLLMVGTGDVARYALQSWDDGETWKKFWDEGFTAWTVMSGGNRYLLGPDELHRHGIVLYDIWNGRVREVWNPTSHGYAGYTYSMVNVDGIYYVAFHTEANEVEEIVPKFGIIVSPDGERWYQFLEWGPLGNHARTDIWLAPAPGLVYASINGALYAFRPLDQKWFSGKEPFK